MVLELYLVEPATPGFEQSGNGMDLFYIADQDVDEDFKLYVVDLATPGAATEVGFTPTAWGNVLESSLVR